MCGWFCIGFIDFIFAEKTLMTLPIFFYQVTLKKKNDDIVLKYVITNV